MPRGASKIVTPKGSRYPGSGRKKGTPNPVSVEARALAVELVNGGEYQRRLRRDFALRRLHPTIESLVWAYAIGKPRQDIQLSGAIDVNARLEAEKRLFLQLDVTDLEALAAESQALMDRANALVLARNGGAHIQDVVVEPEALETGQETLGNTDGSDNTSYDNQREPSDQNPITPTDDGA